MRQPLQRTRWDMVHWWDPSQEHGFKEVFEVSRPEYDHALYRLAAYWNMGQSTITPSEAALSRLDPR